MGFIPNGDNKTNKITSSSSPAGATYLRNLYDVSIVNESLADGELLSFQDGKWSNIAQTPKTYPFSLFQGLSQKVLQMAMQDYIIILKSRQQIFQIYHKVK